MSQMTQEEFDNLTHEQRKNIHLAKVYIELSEHSFAKAKECPPDTYSEGAWKAVAKSLFEEAIRLCPPTTD
jgi:hypothetical protein